MSAFHLDAGFTPLYPFGYGLSYTHFEYRDIALSDNRIVLGSSIEVSATLHNMGGMQATEVAQLYVRDVVGNVTRPVKELKGFQRVELAPDQSTRISFTLHTSELAFFNRKMESVVEPGMFHVWIGGSSEADLWSEFEVVASTGEIEAIAG
jgi:beta-glucosidase